MISNSGEEWQHRTKKQKTKILKRKWENAFDRLSKLSEACQSPEKMLLIVCQSWAKLVKVESLSQCAPSQQASFKPKGLEIWAVFSYIPSKGSTIIYSRRKNLPFKTNMTQENFFQHFHRQQKIRFFNYFNSIIMKPNKFLH